VSAKSKKNSYVPARGRATTIIVLFWITIVVKAVAIISGIAPYSLLTEAARHKYFPHIYYNNLYIAALGYKQFIFIVTAIAYLMWFYRVHKNLPSLCVTRLEYKHWWAIVGFFVPWLSIVRPYQVAQEIWKASDPAQYDNQNLIAWQKLYDSSHIFLWWTLFLLGVYYNELANSAKDVIVAMRAGFASDILHIISAFFAISVVKEIQKRQAKRYCILTAATLGNSTNN